jgi:hypothetical protein
MKNRTILNLVLNLFKQIKTTLSIETLKEGGSVEIGEDGVLYTLNDDGSRGVVVADGTYELENGMTLIVKDGVIIQDQKVEVEVETEMETEPSVETEIEIISNPSEEQVIETDPLTEPTNDSTDYKKLAEDLQSFIENELKTLREDMTKLEEMLSKESLSIKEEITKLSKQPKTNQKINRQVVSKKETFSNEDKAQVLLNNLKNLNK